jgi:NADPH:quinone reductase-like Zn-dependent oxidoreductase
MRHDSQTARTRRRIKVLTAVLAVPAMLVLAGMVVVSHTSACSAPDSTRGDGDAMRAVTYYCYGTADVLNLEMLDVPVPRENELLVRVHAASLNPLEWHYLHGEPYVMRLVSGIGKPKATRLGVDFAGTVTAVGAGVTQFAIGDAVFGMHHGTFADYITVPEHARIARKPANVSYEEAAGTGIAASTALIAVRDKGGVGQGTRVLVNGASGGVGTYTVQIAKHYGAHVTGVSSARNHDLVRSLGADHMIDYALEDFTETDVPYDVIIDLVGNHTLRALRRALASDGIAVLVTGPKHDPWLGPVTQTIRKTLYGPLVSQQFVGVLEAVPQRDMEFLADMMAAGELRTVIDGRFELSEIRDGIAYLERGRTRGKNIVVMVPDREPAPQEEEE